MRKLNILTVLLLFSATCLIAQPIPQVGPFKISTNDTSRIFARNTPRLEVSDSLSFLVVWKDYRAYPAGLFGSRISPQGIPTGPNIYFRKAFDKQPIYSFGNKYLSLTENSWGQGFSFYSVYTANLVLPDGSVSQNLPVTSLGHADLIFYFKKFTSSFVKNGVLHFYASNQQHSRFVKMDSTGSIIRNYYFPTELQYGVSASCNGAGEILIAWLDYNSARIRTSYLRENDTLPVNGDTILQVYSPRADYAQATQIRLAPTPDNNFFLSFFIKDTLYTSVVNWRGVLQRPFAKYVLQASLSAQNTVAPLNYLWTNPYNGVSDLLVTVNNGSSPIVTRTKVFSFDAYGNLTDTAGTFSFTDTIAGGLFKTGRLTYYTAGTVNNDIYLQQLNNFTRSNIRKLNDDAGGTHDFKGTVLQTGQDKYYSVWYDEYNYRIQNFTGSGSISGPAVTVPNSNSIGHPDGSVRFLTILPDSRVLISKYNSSLQLTGSDTLQWSGGFVTGAVSCTGKTLPDGNIVYLVRTTEKSLLILTSPAGNLLAADSLIFAPGTNPALYTLDNNSFYATVGKVAQKYTNTLQRIGTSGYNEQGIYVGGNIFARMWSQIRLNNPPDLMLDMQRTDSTFTVRNKILGYAPKVFYTEHLSINRLGIFYPTAEGTLEFRVLDTLGNDVILPLTVEGNTTKYYTDLSFKTIDNKVFFIWSDNTNINADVFCKIYPIGPLVGLSEQPVSVIPKAYTLSSVYPNPFNLTAKVKFAIPSEGVINLSVYNSLGEQVSVLHNGYLQSGEYEKEFVAHNLPSGIYFVRLSFGSGSVSAKAMLIK